MITVVLPSDTLVQALRRCGDEVFADVLLLELEQQNDFSGKVKVTARGLRDSGYGGRALSDVVRAVSNGRCFTDQLRAELGQVVGLAGDGVLTFEIVLAPSQPPPLPLPGVPLSDMAHVSECTPAHGARVTSDETCQKTRTCGGRRRSPPWPCRGPRACHRDRDP